MWNTDHVDQGYTVQILCNQVDTWRVCLWARKINMVAATAWWMTYHFLNVQCYEKGAKHQSWWHSCHLDFLTCGSICNITACSQSTNIILLKTACWYHFLPCNIIYPAKKITKWELIFLYCFFFHVFWFIFHFFLSLEPFLQIDKLLRLTVHNPIHLCSEAYCTQQSPVNGYFIFLFVKFLYHYRSGAQDSIHGSPPSIFSPHNNPVKLIGLIENH